MTAVTPMTSLPDMQVTITKPLDFPAFPVPAITPSLATIGGHWQ